MARAAAAATGTAIVYSTFLGGSGDDQGYGIAVDGAGNAYVTGRTTSNTFPGVNGTSIQPANGGGLDAFVAKIGSACAIAIGGASANPSVLWPPNHKLVKVTVDYTAIDPCGVTCSLSVASNEGSASDWVVVDTHHVLLRAERAGGGSGRTYTVTITCSDTNGSSSVPVTESVRHDQGHG